MDNPASGSEWCVCAEKNKTAVWSKQSVRTIYNFEQQHIGMIIWLWSFKICLTWCDISKCPQSIFKSRMPRSFDQELLPWKKLKVDFTVRLF